MAFEKEEKEVLTREIISEKLIRRGRRDFFTYLLILLFVRNELVIAFVSGLVYRDGINSVAGVNEAGMRLNYTLSCSSPGDLFYVVTVDREPKTPIYLFPDALFTYREK